MGHRILSQLSWYPQSGNKQTKKKKKRYENKTKDILCIRKHARYLKHLIINLFSKPCWLAGIIPYFFLMKKLPCLPSHYNLTSSWKLCTNSAYHFFGIWLSPSSWHSFSSWFSSSRPVWCNGGKWISFQGHLTSNLHTSPTNESSWVRNHGSFTCRMDQKDILQMKKHLAQCTCVYLCECHFLTWRVYLICN